MYIHVCECDLAAESAVYLEQIEEEEIGLEVFGAVP
jgi:hypothetical protein